MAYDAWNRPWQVTDADSYVTATWYDGEGKEVRIIDGNGHSRRFVRNPLGLVEKAIDAELNSTFYTYDLNGNVTTVTDAKGTVTATTYDAEDRPVTVVEAQGTPVERSKTVVYDKMGNAVEATDYKGNVTKTIYNTLNLPASVTDANNNVTVTVYDRRGKVVSVKDRRNNITTSEYDALGREVKVTDALGQFTQKTYDKVGNVKTVTDKRSIVTENFYDDLYRLTSTKRAGITLVTNEYNKAGNVTAVTDAENHRTEYTYNGRNLLTLTTYADTTTESRSYDGTGNLLTLTNEEGKVTTHAYDKVNRETSVSFAGETTNKTYDSVGNLTLVTRPMGNTKAMTYDALNRLTEVTEGGLVTKYAYDGNSNVTVQMDARGNRVKYEYDVLNRKVKHIQPVDITTAYAYDAEGNMTSMIDAKGQVFDYVYDALNRQTEADYPDVATSYMTPLKVVTAYDANNNVLSVTETKRDADSATVTDLTENVYDDFDRLTSSTQRGVAINYAYDNNGNRTSVSTAAGTTAYTYDSRNRIKTATVGTDVTTYGYTADGKKDTVTYPNGTDVKYTYHPTNRIASIVNKVTADSSVISSYNYEYDSNGSRTSQTEVQNGVTETTTYSYDDLDRMTEFTLTSGADVTVTSYTFEGYNRKTEVVNVNGTATASKTYSYDALDRLMSVTDSVNGKTIGYSYDLNGNMLSRSDSLDSAANMAFEYDALNHLVKSTQVSVVKGLYDYNAGGLRIRHRLSERGDVDYFYDGNAVIEERNATDNSLLAHYRYADRLLSLNTGTSSQYYHHDALGSTVNLTDDSGAVKVSYSLDPWGTIRSQVGSSVNRQIFTGQEYDEQTGLIYFGARYYNSDNARFITQDTYLGEYKTPPSLNRYLYAYSNPTANIDKDGHFVCGGLCIGGAIVGTASLYDYFFSDRREVTAKKYGVETFYGRVGSDTVALAGSVANTVTLGYSDAIQEGGEGALEHSIQLTGYRSYETAYNKIASDDPDYILSALYGLKGLGETASLGLLAAGSSATVKTPGVKVFTKQEAALTLESRSAEISFTEKQVVGKKTTENLDRYSGKLTKVNKPDVAADALAKRLKGQSRVKFESDASGREFDVVSDQYIGQTKPALKSINSKFRNQAKATFEAAKETGKKAYFHFDSQPSKEVLNKIAEYGERYGIEYKIDTKPLFKNTKR